LMNNRLFFIYTIIHNHNPARAAEKYRHIGIDRISIG